MATTLFASIIAGALWHLFGYQATFVAAAVFASSAIVGLALWNRLGTPRT